MNVGQAGDGSLSALLAQLVAAATMGVGAMYAVARSVRALERSDKEQVKGLRDHINWLNDQLSGDRALIAQLTAKAYACEERSEQCERDNDELRAMLVGFESEIADLRAEMAELQQEETG